MELKELQAKLTGALEEMKGLVDRQSAEIKQYGETTTNTAGSIKNVEKAIFDMQNDLQEKSKIIGDLEAKLQRPGVGSKAERKSVGQQFVESAELKQALATGRVETGFVHIEGAKALSSTSLVGMVAPDRTGEIVSDPHRQMTLRDIMTVGSTTSDTIEFTRIINKALVPGFVAELGAAPESSFESELVKANVQRLSHFIPASRQVLNDQPRLRATIDTELLGSMKEVEENQILFGNGVGANLLGIMNDADIQDHGGVIVGDTILDHVRRALTKVKLANYAATGIVLNPVDWESFELLKGDDSHYIWVNVNDGGATRLWRVPVIETSAMTQGNFLTGAFGTAAEIWDREQAAIRISEHHADNFVRGAITILAEERLAMAVKRPQAFVKGVFTAAP